MVRPRYIEILNPTTFAVEQIVFPNNFTCEESLDGTNSLSFDLPPNAELIEVGRLVHYPTLDFGGIIIARDMYLKNGSVKYTGLSWRGMMGNFSAQFKTSSRGIYIYSADLHPGWQTTTTPGEPSELSNYQKYPYNGVYPYLYDLFSELELPFALNKPDEISFTDGTTSRIWVEAGTTVLEFIQQVEQWETGYEKFKFQFKGEPNMLLLISMTENGAYYKDQKNGIPLISGSPDGIVSDEWRPNILWYQYGGSYDYSYLKDDDTYDWYGAGYETFSFHSDIKYKGVQELHISDYSGNADGRKTLKYIREQNKSSNLSSAMRFLYEPEKNSIITCDLNDIVEFTIPNFNMTVKQKIVGKTFELVNGVPMMTIELGGSL